MSMPSENYSPPSAQIHPADAAPLSWSQHLFGFRGRSPRRWYWGGSILSGFVVGLLIIPAVLIFGEDAVAVIYLVLYPPLLWVSFALAIKRLHDRDKSGWFVLINLIPILGGIWFLVEAGFLRGTEGPNQFGPDPT